MSDRESERESDEDREELLPEEAEQEELLEEQEEAEPEGEADEDEDEAVLEKAKKFGHISKEDWEAQGRDPKLYKSPEEFNKTGDVIESRYTELKKKVDQRDREIQALIDYQQRTEQRANERARQELEQRLAAAKDDMDIENVAYYTEELTKHRSNEEHSVVQRAQQLQQEALSQFVERNEHWFNDRNPDLKERAIEIDNELKQLYPNASYEELAKKIESRMQYEHPERVLGQTKARPNISSNNSSVNKTAIGSSVKKVFNGLSQDLKDAYSAHKRIRASMGQELTESEFIERLKKDGEL